MRSRRSSVLRALLLASMTLPLAALAACSGSFSAGNTGNEADSSTDDGSDDGTVVVVNHDAGADAHDATTDATSDANAGDAQGDAQNDGPSDASAGDGFTGCPTGDLTCSGQCVPNDTKNCGSCGHDCTNLPHVSGTVSCDTTTGACSFPLTSCAAGYTDCNGMPDDGCETPISTTGNCGGCNVACDAGAPVCQGSGSSYSCVTGCSGSTPTLCSGSCVNTTDNASNCGSCGHVCPTVANGQPTCASSTCGISCNTNYTDCSGVCVEEATDPNNCGACGKVCPTVANGHATCASSTCGIACNSGYTLCGGACVGPDPTHGVFVAQGNGTSSSCGSESSPCGTLTAAVAVVNASAGAKNIIYVDDHSTLSEPGTVNLPAGVTVEGSWLDSGGVWTYECAPTTLPTIEPASASITIDANYNGSSTLQNLVVGSKATANAGESLYGVFATGATTTLTLTNVRVDVAPGGAGFAGGSGANGTNGAASCPTTSASDGVSGGGGSTGGAGASGYGASGFATTAAGAGTNGKDGDNGTYTAPQCGNACTTLCIFNSGDNLCECTMGQACGAAGAPGCGGTHGSGGAGGGNGGASIGVFAYAATVTIQGGTITTSKGGAGGAGGAGGTASTGGSGATGMTETKQVTCGGASNPCTTTSGSFKGGVGGPGGGGGAGGQGGGGAGGDSYCIAYGGGGVVYAPSLACTPGAAGQAGSPNGVAGHSGQKLTF